jgi:two-component system, chemotaxis family, protein-glutamate methylesterase/glutaminase
MSELTGYTAVLIGASAGGVAALRQILAALPADFALTAVVVQHLHPNQGDYLARHYGAVCPLPVKEADEKEPILPGRVYLAPANYHLLIESDQTFALSIDPKVNYSRPAIDPLFMSGAETYRERVAGLLLTGASQDGAAGLQRIHNLGGLTIVQQPETAVAPIMPRAAIALNQPDYILPLEEIGPFLAQLSGI